MNKRQTENYIFKYLDPYLTKKGYTHKKSEKTQLEYYLKKGTNDYDSFSLSTINYHDSHRLRFGFGKRIGAVEDIMKIIDTTIPFTNPPYREDAHSIGFSYNCYNGIFTDGCFDYMENEQQVKENVNKIIEFSEKEALPFLDKMNDVREIDKRINGDGENFWKADWKKPFNLGGEFVFRRLIIAKLSGRSDYEQLVQKIKDLANGIAREKGKILPWDDLSKSVPYTIHVLKDIQPLY